MKTQVLSVDLLRTDAGTQSRIRINEETVDDYAEQIATSKDWPLGPLDVFHDGNDYLVADGFHRTLAAQRAKRASVPCRIHKGTAIDAKIFGMTANDRHGLRMTRADKRACVEWLLDNCGKMVQSEIAAKAGVTTRTVRSIVAERKSAELPPDNLSRKTSAPPSGDVESGEDDSLGTDSPEETAPRPPRNGKDKPGELNQPVDESGPETVACDRCGGKGVIPVSAEMPSVLADSDEFVNTWQDYVVYRTQSKKKLTTVGINRLFKKLAEWGPNEAVEALVASMENGWTGVFAPKDTKLGGGFDISTLGKGDE